MGPDKTFSTMPHKAHGHVQNPSKTIIQWTVRIPLVQSNVHDCSIRAVKTTHTTSSRTWTVLIGSHVLNMYGEQVPTIVLWCGRQTPESTFQRFLTTISHLPLETCSHFLYNKRPDFTFSHLMCLSLFFSITLILSSFPSPFYLSFFSISVSQTPPRLIGN